jgi:hypothetical protein
VHRLLLNLSDAVVRSLQYLDVDPDDAPMERQGGYVGLAEGIYVDSRSLQVSIPPRCGEATYGAAFVANRVLHSGVDDVRGHFVAAYGYESEELHAARGETPLRELSRGHADTIDPLAVSPTEAPGGSSPFSWRRRPRDGWPR